MEIAKSLFFLPLTVSALISTLATFFVVKFAKKLKIIDYPRKLAKVIHTVPTPRGGGIPIFLSILLASVLFLAFDKRLFGILLGSLILALVGFLDDRFNLNPYLRLFLGFLAAAFPIAAGIGIAFVSNPLGGIIDLSRPQLTFNFFGNHSIWIISDIFALFWITFLMNSINMGAKGVDGQMSGVVTVAAATIALTSLKYSGDPNQWPVIILAGVTAGAFLGFLPWHLFPQKIMPGYGGSTLAGYMLAILSILSTTKVGILVVVLGVPLIDTGYVILRRIFQKKSPVWGDRGHLHHRLLDAGMSKNQVAIFYWTVTAFLGILALNLNTSSKLYTMIGISFVLGALIIWLTRRTKRIL